MKSDMDWGPWIEYGVAVQDEDGRWCIEEEEADDGWLTFYTLDEAAEHVDRYAGQVRVIERDVSRWRFCESG